MWFKVKSSKFIIIPLHIPTLIAPPKAFYNINILEDLKAIWVGYFK